MLRVIVMPLLRAAANAILGDYAEDFKSVTINAFTDTLESVVSGRRSLEEWGGIVAPVIDQTAANVVRNEGIQYVGGRLAFTHSETHHDKIVVAYELYFIDKNEQWTKQTAKSDVYASNFTQEALDEIKATGKVIFELTEDK